MSAMGLTAKGAKVREKGAAFSRFFASLAVEKSVSSVQSVVHRSKVGGKRANRFKLCSLALAKRGGSGCLYRKSSSERFGGGRLYRFLKSSAKDASFYRENWVRNVWVAFFYGVGGVPAFRERLFIESAPIQCSGTVFLSSFPPPFYPSNKS